MAILGTPPKTLAVTWQDVHRDARELCHRLHKRGPWFGIIAITRGGLVPAAIVARELNIRLIDTLCISSYSNEMEQGKLTVLKHVDAADQDGGRGWLIIDDLVDTGATAKMVRDLLPNAFFATLYAKPDGRPLIDTAVGEVPQDTWVFFPWDTEPQFIRPISDSATHDHDGGNVTAEPST